MVTVQYTIAPEARDQLLSLLGRLCVSRVRDGIHSWRAYESPETENIVLEEFHVASWRDHLLQHDRVTKADMALQEEIRGVCPANQPPTVTQYIASN